MSTRFRPPKPTDKSDYYIPENQFKRCVYTALSYNETRKPSIRKMIEDASYEASDDMHEWILKAATGGYTFQEMKGKGMPCERGTYHKMRRRFYFFLNRKIESELEKYGQ